MDEYTSYHCIVFQSVLNYAHLLWVWILQIYGLENEQKKLEEDTVVYNRLQEQLKLSPAYLKVFYLAQTWL